MTDVKDHQQQKLNKTLKKIGEHYRTDSQTQLSTYLLLAFKCISAFSSKVSWRVINNTVMYPISKTMALQNPFFGP